MVDGDLAARELAAEPVHGHGVLAEPRVGGARGGDRLLEIAARIADGLAERDADASLRDELIGHAARPVARAQRPG